MATNLTELNVFRGTYEECMAKTTRDMTIYLAWDTQEIFVGNSKGTKVPYGGSKDLQKKLNKYFESFKTEIFESVGKYSEDIVKNKIAEFEKQYRETIDSLKTEIMTTIDEAVEAKVESSVNSINTSISEINKLYSEVNLKLNTANQDISNLKEAVEELSNKTPDIAVDYSKVLGHLTGDEIVEVKNELTNESDFRPVFCTRDSSTGEYLAGHIYYYTDNEGIVESGGGSSGPSEIVSTLSLDIVNQFKEVSSQTYTLTFTASADNLDAVDGSAILGFNGISSEVDLSSPITRTETIQMDQPKKYLISLDARKKEDTKRFTYRVNPTSTTFEVYQPSFIGTDESNLTNIGREYKKTLKPDVTSKDTSGNVLYLYTSGKVNSIYMGLFPYPFEEVSSSYPLIVNEVTCYYYKYSLGTIYDSLDDLIIA